MTMLLLGDAFSCARIYVLISGGCHSALAVAPVKAFKVFAVPASFTLFGRLFQSLLNSYRSSFFQQVVRACCRSRFSPYVRSLKDLFTALTEFVKFLRTPIANRKYKFAVVAKSAK